MPINKFRFNKYKAVRSKCALGHNHPSKLEASYCQQLQMLQKNGDIIAFESQKKYELRVNGKLIGCHKPDFTVIDMNGKVSVHETKGMSTSDWILRKNLFEALYPDIPYIVVK